VSDRTLRTLIAVSRSKPVERELCCPNCGAVAIVLCDGAYRCCSCFLAWATLAELAVLTTTRTES
jgi:hypothetical protein